MELPNDRPPPAAKPHGVAAATRRVAPAIARRTIFGFGVREVGIGALALAVLTATGLLVRERGRQQDAELAGLRTQLALQEDAADVYVGQYAALKQQAAQIRSWADTQATEPMRTWARERARRFDVLVARVEREGMARAFAASRKPIRDLIARGDLEAPKAQMAANPPPVFPTPADFSQLKEQHYEAPLSDFSRQNPAFYRALRQYEAELAQKDEQALRREIVAAGAGDLTPQLMLKVDLLAAVAAADDPVVAEWSAMASALDYFEDPDAETLGRWRRAQQATRRGDWAGAAQEMQAIMKSRVRTRQPFRASLGRALLKSRPDQPEAAYPFLAEAAAGGDKSARAWAAKEDYRQGRLAQAQRWLEAAVADGEFEGVPLLLELYQATGATDPAHQIGVLDKVVDRPGVPAEALLFLGRLYERLDPPGSRPSRALTQYQKAAARGSAEGNAEVARCALKGKGMEENSDLARDAACRAFALGERKTSVPILIELMNQMPERTAGAVQQMFESESVGGGGGYTESRVVDGPGVNELKSQLARYLDRIGMYGQAARFYRGARDAAAARRHAELTAVHPCDTCGGSGKVKESASCPTCGGKGTQICSTCGGNGFRYVPGTPPCATCGGSGTMVQERKTVACSTCGGSGKGKGTVVKQDCPECEHGHIDCAVCVEGMVSLPKDCPECRGRGSWKLSDK